MHCNLDLTIPVFFFYCLYRNGHFITIQFSRVFFIVYFDCHFIKCCRICICIRSAEGNGKILIIRSIVIPDFIKTVLDAIVHLQCNMRSRIIKLQIYWFGFCFISAEVHCGNS